ncbi:MAG: hypothetical protein KAT77_00780 [Nanoarchaeota archaeon]|nr:hypothetical protein [Nanoarchaeota archaeon]
MSKTDKIITKLSYPAKKKGLADIFVKNIQNTNKNIYEVVNFLEKKISLNKMKLKREKVSHKIFLRKIINLHNIDGIKDKNSEIKEMIQEVKSYGEILYSTKLPNIKLLKIKKNKLILFDGHHSILTYMYFRRRHLHEVPHLIIFKEKGYVSEKEIFVFFGKHANKVKELGWEKCTINWQAPESKQLCRRRQKNIGELFDCIYPTL